LLSVLQINQDCGFFEWVDPKLCEHGKRVARQLQRRHRILLAEVKRCETMVKVKVGKVKAEMEKEVGKFRAIMEKQAIN
jgi:hypothetical protein